MPRAFVYHICTCTTDDLDEADDALIEEASDLAYSSFPNHTLGDEHLDLFVDRHRCLFDRPSGKALRRSLRDGYVVVLAAPHYAFGRPWDFRYVCGKLPEWGVSGYYVYEGDLRPLVEDDPVMLGVLDKERRERRSIETRRGVQMAQREGRPHCRAKIGYRLHKGQMLPDLKDRELCRMLLRLNNEGVSCEKLCWRFAIDSTSTVHKRIHAAREQFPLNPYMRLDDDGEEILYCDPGTAPWPSEFEALERRNWSAPVADSCA